jgi:hypothetical protein
MLLKKGILEKMMIMGLRMNQELMKYDAKCEFERLVYMNLRKFPIFVNVHGFFQPYEVRKKIFFPT